MEPLQAKYIFRSKPLSIWIALGFFGISHSVNAVLFAESTVLYHYLRFNPAILNIQNFVGSLTCIAAFIALLCRVPVARRLSLLALSIYFANVISRLRVGGFALEPSAEFLRGSAMLALILLMVFLFSRRVADHLNSKPFTSATP